MSHIYIHCKWQHSTTINIDKTYLNLTNDTVQLILKYY